MLHGPPMNKNNYMMQVCFTIWTFHSNGLFCQEISKNFPSILGLISCLEQDFSLNVINI